MERTKPPKTKTKLPRELGDRFSAQDAALKEVSARLDDMAKTMAKRHVDEMRIRELDVLALIRRLYLDAETLPFPHRLIAQRFKVFSQNGEDGISLAIFKMIGMLHQSFVDIGCGPNGGNSGFFAQEFGWRGLMVDGASENIVRIRQRFPSVTSHVAWVDRDNIDDLFREHGFEGEIDLLSIDIDGNDYWIWEGLTVCRPRLVIVEYNSAYGPDRSIVVPYSGQFDRKFHKSVYYGASLAALTALANRKGYRLIAAEPRGINAFFLRNDVGEQIPPCTVASVYRLLERNEDRVDIYQFTSQHGLPLQEVGSS